MRRNSYNETKKKDLLNSGLIVDAVVGTLRHVASGIPQSPKNGSFGMTCVDRMSFRRALRRAQDKRSEEESL